MNTRLIVEAWENRQRIVVSLALKPTTQRMIVGQLRVYARNHTPSRALWAYDHLIRRRYLLDDVDAPPLRRNVQRALNRGEHDHP
jgi:TnpA family transposase